MRDVWISGAGMTRFAKWPDRSLKDLGGEATLAALADADLAPGDVQASFVGNAVAGLMTGQEQVRGQTILRELGIGGGPIVNTENACASSSTGAHLAWLYVASGQTDNALVLGVEKLVDPVDKKRGLDAISTAVDIEERDAMRDRASVGGRPADRPSFFMEVYAAKCRLYMERYGWTPEQFALAAVKSHANAALNPYAQFQKPVTIEQVLGSPMVADPLTVMMCAPVGDGAAALVFSAHKPTGRPAVRIAASVLGSGSEVGEATSGAIASKQAYEKAGLGPGDLDVLETHDASAPAELFGYETVGLCGPGEAGALIESGKTALGGRWPVNPSGGLQSRGHPIGATGAAQLVELVWQLRGEAGARQVKDGRPRVAMAQNGGGNVKGDAAAMAIHILTT